MKTITIAGNITKDGQLRRTQDGTAVLGFSVAVNDRNKNATFFDVSMFGKRGEGLEPYMKKGTFACVTGDFSTREYEGKTYLMVNANEISFTSPKPKMDDQQSGYQGLEDQRPLDQDDDSEIPF